MFSPHETLIVALPERFELVETQSAEALTELLRGSKRSTLLKICDPLVVHPVDRGKE